MTNKRIALFLGLAFILLCVCLLCAPFLKEGIVWLGILYNGHFGENPPEPAIKYGEFPFWIEFQLGEEIIVIEDTAICEFIGFENLRAAGKKRKWKTYLKSGRERITLLKDNNIELYFSYGTAEFYMGDNFFKNPSVMNYNPKIIDSVIYENGKPTYSTISSTEAWEKYGLKILDWQYSAPIKNSFVRN